MKIKDCPFCGSEAWMVIYAKQDESHVAVRCRICYAQSIGMCFKTPERLKLAEKEAIQFWNKRVL